MICIQRGGPTKRGDARRKRNWRDCRFFSFTVSPVTGILIGCCLTKLSTLHHRRQVRVQCWFCVARKTIPILLKCEGADAKTQSLLFSSFLLLASPVARWLVEKEGAQWWRKDQGSVKLTPCRPWSKTEVRRADFSDFSDAVPVSCFFAALPILSRILQPVSLRRFSRWPSLRPRPHECVVKSLRFHFTELHS